MQSPNPEKIQYSRISRRQFLNTAGTAATFSILPRHVLGGQGYTPPSERLNIAMIGTGGQGLRNLRNLVKEKDVQIVALSDTAEIADYSYQELRFKGGRLPGYNVVKAHYEETEESKRTLQCGVYVDFREMLDKEKDVDAVVVSCPTFTHYIAAMDAIGRGKHVYLEKPMAKTLYEVRKLTEAARRAGVVTQLGHQGHGKESLRLTKEWIQAGVIGDVIEVHAWADEPDLAGTQPLPQGSPPVPKGLDWDFWQGPVKRREYQPVYTPKGWNDFHAYGTSRLPDLGSHHMDPAFYALELGRPEWVEARSAWADKTKNPLTAHVHFQFSARGNQPPVRLTWWEGSKPIRPDEMEPGKDLSGGPHGILFIGDKGKIMCPGWAGTPTVLPRERWKSFKRPEKTIRRVRGIYRDWIDSIKEGRKASSDWVEYSGQFSESILAGELAMRVEGRCYMDWENLKVKNFPEAESLIIPEYHNGWKL
ncbi:MAG: Gfo/Idh/MocA family protein [Opitutales bacterium]